MGIAWLINQYYRIRSTVRAGVAREEGPIIEGDPLFADFALFPGIFLGPLCAIIAVILLSMGLIPEATISGSIAFVSWIVAMIAWMDSEVIPPDREVTRVFIHTRVFGSGRFQRLFGAKSYRVDTTWFEIHTSTHPTNDSVVAQVHLLPKNERKPDGVGVRETQLVALGFEVAASISANMPRSIMRLFRDNINTVGDAMSVIKKVTLSRLADAVNEVFANGDGVYIEDLLTARVDVNRQLKEKLAESMELYKIDVISVLIEEEPVDVNGEYLLSRAKQIAARARGKADEQTATANQTARIAEAKAEQQIGITRAERDRVILVELEKVEDQRKLTEEAKQSALLQDLEQLKTFGIPAQFTQLVSSIRSMSPEQVSRLGEQIAAAAGQPGAKATGALTIVGGEDGGGSSPLSQLLTALAAKLQSNP